METEIYLLVDCDGEVICSYADKDKAEYEAKECGCYVKISKIYKSDS